MQEETQELPNTLREKLLQAVDAEYNVKDMPMILEVLGKLEVLHVSKEILETTRLGKTVNEFRRKVKDVLLSKRLKELVKKWRDAVLVDPTRVNGSGSVEGGPPRVGGPLHFASGYTSASSSPTLSVTAPSSTSAPSHRVNSCASPYNSNSLSPRVLGTPATNYHATSNNNTSVHNNNLPANRNGSSSLIGNSRSPNNHLHLRNAQHQLSSPSSSTASPHQLLSSPASRISPYKSKSPGGPTLAAAFNNAINANHASNLSPLSSSQFQSSSSSYAPNAETVSRTNAANKRLRESDDIPIGSAEPPHKKSRTAANGTLDDPLLALDDISRDSYASRGSDHSDGFASKDNRFSVSLPSPAATASSTLSPQLSAWGGPDSNVPSPATPFDYEISTQVETQPKKKRRKKQNEFVLDSDAILREKMVQAQAEKAAKAAREAQKKLEQENELKLQESRRRAFEDAQPDDKLMGNVFVDGYLKSQNELRAKMVRDAEDVLLSESDFQGAQQQDPANATSTNKLSKKEKKKHKKKQLLGAGTGTADQEDTFTPFKSEAEILAQLPPIDPEILKEFQNFEYDVNPSPPPAPPPTELSAAENGDIANSLNKETENLNKSKSLSTEEKPRKIIDWGDSDDEEENITDQSTIKTAESEADIIQVIADEPPTEPVPSPTSAAVSSLLMETEEDDFCLISSLPPPVEEPSPPAMEIDDAEVERYIKENIPNLNGNYDREGQFREWHETLTVDSYKEEPLHILPYTIIDF